MKAVRVHSSGNCQSSILQNESTIRGQNRFEKTARIEIGEGRYVVKFARSAEEVDAALRLRFEVFNLELGEGLESSYLTGRDEDRFDRTCHHLIVQEKDSGAVVGTYRPQTLEMAKNVSDFYCSGEFKIEDLPPEVLSRSLEIGRACVALEHRGARVLFLLWKGLAAFMTRAGKRYLFGCCSLTSQAAAEGWRAWRRIELDEAFHPEFFVEPRDRYVCEAENSSAETDDPKWQLPKLFLTYLRFGAKVCSPPAIDREFKTIDFFVMFDFETIDEKYRQMFLSGI